MRTSSASARRSARSADRLAWAASSVVFDPRLAANGVYNAVVIIVLFWGGVLLCSLGPALVARLGSGGTRIGKRGWPTIRSSTEVADRFLTGHPDPDLP